MTDDPSPTTDDALPPELAESLGIDVDEFADQATPPPAPDEPAETDFYAAGPDAHALDDLDVIGRTTVLERLGPAHFRSKGFSFMGFLQTVYEHVATQAAGKPEKQADSV